MNLLQSGVAAPVIALWLGQEDPATTHQYIEDCSGKSLTDESHRQAQSLL
jgi:hypothetical protein